MSGPAYLKDRKAYVVPESEYDVDPVAGTITFHQAQPSSAYIYVTLGNDYLRNTNIENRFCLDCHTEYTHKYADCTICHGTHGTANLYNVREKMGTPAGYRDISYTNASGMSGAEGVCVVCHTTTMYHNSTSLVPLPHHEGSVCTDCHPHDRGFPSFTTVFNPVKRWFAGLFETGSAYAKPPAWVTDGSLPPGLAEPQPARAGVGERAEAFQGIV